MDLLKYAVRLSPWIDGASKPAPAARDPSANYYGYPAHLETAHHHGVDFSSYNPYTTPNSVNNNWSLDPA
jgi:hypothetical protein